MNDGKYWKVLPAVRSNSESEFYISCYNLDTRELDRFKVDPSVYTYIRQLEMYIDNPEVSQLRADHAYAFRFPAAEATKEKYNEK